MIDIVLIPLQYVVTFGIILIIPLLLYFVASHYIRKSKPAPMAGKTVILKTGQPFLVDDWWDRISHRSWWFDKNTYCKEYSMRVALYKLPFNNRVLLGRVDGVRMLIHESEIVK